VPLGAIAVVFTFTTKRRHLELLRFERCVIFFTGVAIFSKKNGRVDSELGRQRN
jgi:hypothetical protein